MATFLVSSAMNPALRARVERAVSRRLRAKQNAGKLGYVPFEGRAQFPVARVLPLFALAIVIAMGVTIARSAKRDLESARSSLLEDLASRRAGMPAGYTDFLATTDSFVLASATSPSPDDVTDASAKGAAFDRLLRRPAVYLHATASQLASKGKIDETAGAAIKDAFLYCLLVPPDAKDADVMSKVRGTYFGGSKLDEETANVRRLADARMGLSVLGADFETVVKGARDLATITRLKRVLADAPTDRSRDAVAAQTLILVTDATAQDGSRESRVSLVDIPTKRVLYRGRPSYGDLDLGPKNGSHRAQLEDCAHALDVRRSMR